MVKSCDWKSCVRLALKGVGLFTLLIGPSWLAVLGKTVVMDLATAKRFAEAVASVGHYHGLLD